MPQPSVKGTQSVLDAMTSAITNRKVEAAGVTLTPVGVEKQGPLDGKHALTFPYDDPQTIRSAIRDGLKVMAQLQEHIDHVGQGLIALGQLYGLRDPEAAPVVVVPDIKAEEAAADAKAGVRALLSASRVTTPETEAIIERMAAIKQAAKAATFADAEPVNPVVDHLLNVIGAPGWECPDHGATSLVTKPSRKGRMYRLCAVAGCGKFEVPS